LHVENTLLTVNTPAQQEEKSYYIGGTGLQWKRYGASMTIDEFLLDDKYLTDDYEESELILDFYTQSSR
jgi:hypothetical protein